MEEEIRISRNLLKTVTVDTRASILKLLEERSMTASEISRALNKHVTTVSEHLEMLNESGLVERLERHGKKWIYYKLTKDAVRILHPKVYSRWVLVLSLTMIVFVGSLASSVNANPGDALYGLKRTVEAAKLLLAPNELEKVKVHLAIADERLRETKAVAAENDIEATKKLVKEYRKEVEDANIEIDKARKNGKEVTPLLEEVNENTAKHISILQNINGEHSELKNEIEPILNVSIESNQKSKSELEEQIKEKRNPENTQNS